MRLSIHFQKDRRPSQTYKRVDEFHTSPDGDTVVLFQGEERTEIDGISHVVGYDD